LWNLHAASGRREEPAHAARMGVGSPLPLPSLDMRERSGVDGVTVKVWMGGRERSD